jgi:predicted nucleic acid-binding protein
LEAPAHSVFISYAHRDNEGDEPSKRWLDRLMEHLEPLVQQGQVRVWSDREIEAGDDWHEKIQAALRDVKAAVLLVSPAFLASKYIRNSELPVLLRQAQETGAVIIPLILRPSLFRETKFKYPDPAAGPEEFSLASLQAANSPLQPLNNMSEYQQDQVLVAVAQRLLRIVGAEDEPPAPGPPDAPPPGGPGLQRTQGVGDGLRALSDLMEAPEVRDAVIAFRTDFEAASRQIEVLKAYKDLHDRLHALQFQCYERVVAEAARFPDDEVARDNLSDHEQTLLSTVVSIRGGGNGLGQFDTSWMVRDLDEALREMHAALEESDRRRLNRSASLLGRVLNVYPAQVNTRLNETAKTLRLPSLVRAMTLIRDRLLPLNLDQGKVAQFVKGVADLTSLDGELRGLLLEHDRWQIADGELRLIRPNAGELLEELDASWPRLKELTEPLYVGSADEWAAGFRADTERVAAALSSQNLAKVRESFRRYRRSAGLRFFEVDVKLKTLCSHLLTVGEPLVSVLRMLE